METEREQESGGREEEPDVRGTVFLMVIFLMLMVAMWGIMYFELLGR